MGWQWAVQLVEVFDREADAKGAMEFLARQDGFMAGRIVRQHNISTWSCQAMFEDCGEENGRNLPDGMRRVYMPPGFLKSFSYAAELKEEVGRG